jgi:hypothetical protein
MGGVLKAPLFFVTFGKCSAWPWTYFIKPGFPDAREN